MNPPAVLAARRPKVSWMMHAWGVAAGLGFTAAIAAGLAYFSQAPPATNEEVGEEIRSIEIPEPPPPPPVQPLRSGTPLSAMPMVFEEAPSTSSSRIAPTPIPIAPSIVEIRPTLSLRFDLAPGQFDPGSGGSKLEVNHIFQQSEVDQQIVAVFKKVPNISAALLREVKNTRVRVLFVVNTDGTVENVTLLKGSHPEFDRLVLEAIREWRFRPAMRKGRKVRCLSELPVYVKPPKASPFSTH